ncbi:MAG TPA: hypothetical protein VLU47_04475 [Blastocatellia bacterium]|nr:hypothetical protein [Blastocatellia bacterium]
MNVRFRCMHYAMSALLLFLTASQATGQEVIGAQSAGHTRDQTVINQQKDGNLEDAGPIALPAKTAASANATEATSNESSAFNTAPISFLAPRPLPPPGEHLSPEPASSRSQAPSSDKWQFMVAPYLWIASISGELGVGDVTTEVDPSFSDILDSLNFGFMGVFEARKNKFMLITDLFYISLEETKSASGPLFSALTAESKTFMLSPVVGYRLAEKEGASLDALVGIRFWHTSTRLELEPGLLAGRVRDNSKNWADVIGGLRGQAHLTRIFSLIGRGDLGGGGSDFTYHLFGGVGIDLSESVSLFAGYRYLHIKYDRDDFLFDGAFKGTVLGAAFRF